MRKLLYRIIFICFIIISNKLAAQNYTYIYPKPGSEYNSANTDIILRTLEKINKSEIENKSLITVTGSKSGLHQGAILIGDDERTIIFKPSNHFDDNEEVTVKLDSGVQTLSGNLLDAYSFLFYVSPMKVPLRSDLIPNENYKSSSDFSPENYLTSLYDSLPPDYPKITINKFKSQTPGYYYLANIPEPGYKTDYSNYLMILDNAGHPISYKKVGNGEDGYGYNLKRENNGQIIYQQMNNNLSKIYILNDILYSIDSITASLNSKSIFKDVQLLPNGHRILMRYQYIPFDFSFYSEKGNPNGSLITVVIQEYDKNKNQIFHWRSIDYLPVTETYEPLTTQTVPYINSSNIELDNDGNLLLSNTNMSSIIKINRETGEIMWKLGGKSNEFNFIGEHNENAPNYFSYQNFVQKLPNGNIALFDNGTQHNPQYSRVVEYKLDESAKTCEMVWEYRHNPDIYSAKDGSIQYLQDGFKLIYWGLRGKSGGVSATELQPDNSVSAELALPEGQMSMRIFKYPWPACEPTQVTIYELMEGNTYPMSGEKIGIIVKFKKLSGFIYNGLKAERYECGPVNPEFIGKAPIVLPYRINMKSSLIDSAKCEIRFNLNEFPNLYRQSEISVYNKKSDTSRYYSELPTYYEPTSNELIINSDNFGDFIFCIPENSGLPLSPILVSPENNFKTNANRSVRLNWTLRGYTTETQILVGTDETFLSGIVADTIIKSTHHRIPNLNEEQKYYWKVRGGNESGFGEWSDTWSFTPSPEFIKVTYPAEGDVLNKDTLYHIIRWTKNNNDTVKIDLFKNGQFYSNIIESFVSQNGAYPWQIPSSIPYDSDYSIVISSTENNEISGIGGLFSISSLLGVNDEITKSENGVVLYQNYPNPVNVKTSIKFYLDKFSNCSLKIFDVQGREVANILEAQLHSGSYIVDWDASKPPSGIYVYQLIVEGIKLSGRLIISK